MIKSSHPGVYHAPEIPSTVGVSKEILGLDFTAKHHIKCFPTVVPASSLYPLSVGGAFPNQSLWDHPQKGGGATRVQRCPRLDGVFSALWTDTAVLPSPAIILHNPFFYPFCSGQRIVASSLMAAVPHPEGRARRLMNITR